jgi:hypothetical protein
MGGRWEGRGEGDEAAEEGPNRMALQCGVRNPGAVDEAGERRHCGGRYSHGRWLETALATWEGTELG